MEEEGKGRGERKDQYRSSEITYNVSRKSHVQDLTRSGSVASCLLLVFVDPDLPHPF